MKKIVFIFILIVITFALLSGGGSAEEAKIKPKYAGEIFGVTVPMDNYYVVKSAIQIFGNNWGAQPQTPQELDGAVWDELVLSFEAFRRNITVSRDEISEEVTKTLKSSKVEFDWVKDKDAYATWLKEKTGEPPQLFEEQIRHLMQIRKLRTQVMESIIPSVTDDEAYQEFLNEYNTLSVELLQFDELKSSEDFYKKIKKSAKLWDKEKKKRPKDFKRPGFVSLEFLMDMWKFPKADAYKMIKMKAQEFYPPAPIYKGYGVFRILETRPAEEAKYPQLKESYYAQLKTKKKYAGFNDWFKKFKEQANIKKFKEEDK
jgi:hypothetical protein